MKQPALDPNKQFMELYEAFSDEIFRFSLGQTRNRDLALDVTQETFIKTWDYLRGGKTIDMGRAFLYKTCRNLIIDHRRKKHFESLDVMFENHTTPEPADLTAPPHGADIDKQYLIQTLKSLPEHHYEVLMLRYIQDLTLSEIAIMYNESENNVSVRIHRAARHAEKLLGPNKEDL